MGSDVRETIVKAIVRPQDDSSPGHGVASPDRRGSPGNNPVRVWQYDLSDVHLPLHSSSRAA